MSKSTNLKMPFIVAEQALKHITHNEAIKVLDAIVHLNVLDRDLTAAPASPVDGDRYIVGAGATGDWAGSDMQIAAWQDNAWIFYAPLEGWLVWIADELQLFVWAAGSWSKVSDSDLQNIPMLGINATADSTNRLSVSAPATLLNNEGAGHQIKINKNGSGDTASMLFQTGFSGRAEFGTTGDDDWHVKVSADGSVWNEALIVDRNTGRINFPSGGARNQISADKTYYVDGTTGSDSNNGETAGTAFATLTKAVAVVVATDLGGYHITIDVANGTYTESLYLLPLIAGSCTISGDIATPSNVVWANVGSQHNMTCTGQPEQWKIEGVKLTGNKVCIEVRGGQIRFANIEFAGTNIHMRSNFGGTIIADGNYSISASALEHMRASHNSIIAMWGKTVTLIGTPNFSTAFARGQDWGFIRADGGMTYSGAATGKRYSVEALSGISTAGGGASYFPGDAAGTTSLGGSYV